MMVLKFKMSAYINKLIAFKTLIYRLLTYVRHKWYT